MACVEQSSSILNVTFLSSFKTNRLHFAVLLFSYNEEKKRNKTKIVMRTSLTVTCSLANAFYLATKSRVGLIREERLFFVKHNRKKAYVLSLKWMWFNSNVLFCNYFVSNLLQSVPPLLLKEIF